MFSYNVAVSACAMAGLDPGWHQDIQNSSIVEITVNQGYFLMFHFCRDFTPNSNAERPLVSNQNITLLTVLICLVVTTGHFVSHGVTFGALMKKKNWKITA